MPHPEADTDVAGTKLRSLQDLLMGTRPSKTEPSVKLPCPHGRKLPAGLGSEHYKDAWPWCPCTGDHGMLARRVDVGVPHGERMRMAAGPAVSAGAGHPSDGRHWLAPHASWSV